MAEILTVIVAIVLCVAGFLWLKFNQGKESKVAAKTEEKQSTGNESLKTNQQQKPEAAAKKVKKDEKQKHHQCIFEVKGHKDGMNCFMFSGTGKLAASTGDDRRVIIWDATKFPPIQLQNVIPELDHPVSVAFSPDDSYFAVAYATSKEIKIFAVKGVKEGAKVSIKTNVAKSITEMHWSYNGKYLAICSTDDKESVRLFKASGEPLGVINPGALVVYHCVISPDSRFVAVASMQCDVKIWEVGADKEGFRLFGKVMELTGRSGGGGATGHSAAVHSVDFGGCSPAVLVCESTRAATVSKDGKCKIWNIDVRYKMKEDPKCLLTIDSPDTKPIDLVAIARGKESKIVATWSKTAGLCFYALPTGELLSQIPFGETGQVFQMIWSPDSITDKGGKTYQQVLCTVSKDGRTRAWTPTSG